MSSESQRSVSIRGVDVLVSELPALRDLLESLSTMVQAGMTIEATDGSPVLEAMEFLAQAGAAGYPTRPSDIPDVLEEIDAAISEASGLN